MQAVLIIDPQPVVREGIGRVLREAIDDIDLVEAGGAVEARCAVRERRIDLIIVEPDLPDADGLRLIKELRAGSPGTPILAFSALASGEIARRALNAGASAFGSKDAPVSEIAETARDLLAAAGSRVADTTGLTRRFNRVFGSRAQPPGSARKLSDRELQVLRLLSQGYSAPQAGQRLNISAKTVNTHRRHIYRKLGLRDVSDLAAYAFRHGLVRDRRVSSEG